MDGVIIVVLCIMIERRKRKCLGMLEERTTTENRDVGERESERKGKERKKEKKTCSAMSLYKSIRKTMRMDQHPEAEAYK